MEGAGRARAVGRGVRLRFVGKSNKISLLQPQTTTGEFYSEMISTINFMLLASGNPQLEIGSRKGFVPSSTVECGLKKLRQEYADAI